MEEVNPDLLEETTAEAEIEDGEEQAVFDFDETFQIKILSLMARDSSFAVRVRGILKPEYFSSEASSALVALILDHIGKYRSAPGLKILTMLVKDAKQNKIIRSDTIADVVAQIRLIGAADISNGDFVLDRVSDFARRQAVEQAMIASIKALDKGDFATIEKRFKEALSVGVSNDSGTYDYWKEAETRAQYRHDINSGKMIKRGISTGYNEIDSRLYHGGWGRGELSVIMGAAKAGKSLSLGDFSKNASLLGYTTLYASLEVSQQIISDRLDAAVTDTLISQLHMDPDEVLRKLQILRAKAAPFHMRTFPSGTLTPAQLHRVIENYRSDGVIFDLLTIDYADIMAANYRSDRVIDNLREIYIDLRAIASEFDAALLTATQTNRDGAKSITARATDVGDDWNKIRTADIVIGINATDAEKQAGEARLYWAISRNTRDGFTLRIKQDRSRMKFLTKVIGEE